MAAAAMNEIRRAYSLMSGGRRVDDDQEGVAAEAARSLVADAERDGLRVAEHSAELTRLARLATARHFPESRERYVSMARNALELTMAPALGQVAQEARERLEADVVRRMVEDPGFGIDELREALAGHAAQPAADAPPPAAAADRSAPALAGAPDEPSAAPADAAHAAHAADGCGTSGTSGTSPALLAVLADELPPRWFSTAEATAALLSKESLTLSLVVAVATPAAVPPALWGAVDHRFLFGAKGDKKRRAAWTAHGVAAGFADERAFLAALDSAAGLAPRGCLVVDDTVRESRALPAVGLADRVFRHSAVANHAKPRVPPSANFSP